MSHREKTKIAYLVSLSCSSDLLVILRACQSPAALQITWARADQESTINNHFLGRDLSLLAIERQVQPPRRSADQSLRRKDWSVGRVGGNYYN